MGDSEELDRDIWQLIYPHFLGAMEGIVAGIRTTIGPAKTYKVCHRVFTIVLNSLFEEAVANAPLEEIPELIHPYTIIKEMPRGGGPALPIPRMGTTGTASEADKTEGS